MAATAIVVTVPELERLVGAWRRAHTADAADGMPPHVTLLYPFVDESGIAGELGAVGEVLEGFVPFDVRFVAVRRFEAEPPVLYLPPEPAEPFGAMTAALVERFPGFPPYAGLHDTVIPHLTVAYSADEALLERVGSEIREGLPLVARVREVQVMGHRLGEGWSVRHRIAL